MTGFGSAEGNVLGGRLSIEIRSVNHRYYNPQLKLPFELGGVEGPLRERLRQLLERGHVTVTARWIEAPQREATVAVDLSRARQLVAAAKELKKRLKLKGDVDLAFVARQPEVLTPHQDGVAAPQWSDVEPIAERAVRELLGMRTREGPTGPWGNSSGSSGRSCCARSTPSGRRPTMRPSRRPSSQ